MKFFDSVAIGIIIRAAINDRSGTKQYNNTFSRFSSFEMNKTPGDKFERVLYNILPPGSKVNIQLCIPVLFNNFMQVLEKEFISPQ